MSTFNPSNYPLTLLYDGNCPVCCLEMHALRDLALAQNPQAPALKLVNIAEPNFDAKPYGASLAQMNALIHAQCPDGSLVIGLDALLMSYAAVGTGRWMQWFRWPILKLLSDAFYGLFARHRYAFSRYLAPLYARFVETRLRSAALKTLAASQACHDGACQLPNSEHSQQGASS